MTSQYPRELPDGNNDHMQDLKERTIRGGLAKICSQGANFVLRLGSLMILGRLLDPKDFGLVGMVTAVTGVLTLFKDFGLSTAAVQQAEVTNEQVSTLFWINIFVGTILGLIAFGMAPLAVTFYHEPRLFSVTVVLAAGFVLNAAGVQHTALLQRQMRFTALAVIEVLSLVISTAIAVGMAFKGYGYWALVGMALASPIVSSACAWIATAWVPAMPRRRVGIYSMMRYGSTITLNGLVVYVAYNLEKVLLGRFWGADAVGLYGRAYQLINIPTSNLNDSIGGVAFAALSRLQGDPARIRSYFLKGYGLVLALTVPATVLCALFADDLIFVLLGPKWKEAAPIFRLLAPTIMIFALINPLGWLLYSLGLVGRSLKIALVIAPLVIAGYLVGLPYGPKGVALGYSTAMLVWVVPHIAWCIRGTSISFQDILRVLSRPLISALIAAAVAAGGQLLWGNALPPLPRLLLGAGVLTIVYLGTLLYAMGQKTVYVDLLRTIRAGRTSVPDKAFASV